MIHMHGETMIQKLALIKRVTGHELRIKPLDEITDMKVDLDAGIVVVKMTTHTFQERRHTTLITGRGVRLVAFNRVPGTDQWTTERMEPIWEDDFEPVVIDHFGGPVRTLAQDVQQRTWERMAGRAGAGRAPMDTYSRVGQGYSTDRMIKHWN